MCFTLVGCGKTKDDVTLTDVYNKVDAYENADHNLSATIIDKENNIVVVELIDNSKEKQEEFKQEAKLTKNDLKYIKFVQGGINKTT